MFLSINFLLFAIALIVLCIHTYNFYNYIFPTKDHSSNKSLVPYNNFRLQNIVSAGALVPYGGGAPNGDMHDGASTVVELTDAELNELLQIVFDQIGNSNLISIELLQSFGLDTETVINYLTSLGYIIF
jgi:hypothetical protein